MPYDKQIPEALQLLRLDDGLDETALARYTLSDWNTNYEVPFFCVIDPSDADAVDMMDIHGALEETLHLILDNGGTPDDVRQIMGLEQESEIDPDIIMDGDYTPIDLGYCFSGQLLSWEAVPPETADDLGFLTEQQISNIEMSNAGEQRNFLPAAKLLAAHDFTSWQAFAVCKAFREGIDRDCIQTIADPKLNHSQMRELTRIASIDGYPSPVFKQCAERGYPAENLRGIRRLMADVKNHDASFDYGWLDLDAAQLAEVDFAVKMDVPADALARYATGEYPADSMALITLGLSDGIEQPRIDRMLNPELSQTQLTPQQMKSIQFSLEGGTPVADAARQKTQMVKGNRETGETSRTGSLRDMAEESRAASSQLHEERPGERTEERGELE